MPEVSVLLPLFNGAPYLARQLDSILAQTHDDFELLVIDDGSDDHSLDIAQRYAGRDGRIRLLPSTGRVGQNKRLAALTGEAAGTFVSIADQDDVWDRDRTARLVAGIGDAAIAVGRSELIDRAGDAIGTTLLAQLGRSLDSDVRLQALAVAMFSGHASLIRREAVNPAAFAWPLSFDWMMALDAIFSGGLHYVNDAVVFHRIHGDNQSNNIDTAKRHRRSGGFLRDVFLHRNSGRLHLWLTLEYLGRSPVIPPDRRRDFAGLATHAYMAWYSTWRTLKPGSADLAQDLKQRLRPLAGSAADWRWFAERVDMLTAPTVSRTMARETYQRLVHLRQ